MWCRSGGQWGGEGALGQRTYRVALVLLSGGALFNCVGSAQAHAQPLRYVGAACVCAGALLVCAALARWLLAANANAHPATAECGVESVVSCKPPDYDSVAPEAPPSYEDAVKQWPAPPPCG